MGISIGCTDTPFLASCRCRTRVGHRYGYDSPDSGVWRVSLFFFFFFASPTRLWHGSEWLRRGSDTPAMEKKKKKNHRCLTSHLSPLPLPLPSVARRSKIEPIGELLLSPSSSSASFSFSFSLLSHPDAFFVFFFCFFYVFFLCFVHFNFSNTFLYFLFVLWVFCQPHVKVTLTIEYMSAMMSLICHWSKRK